MFNPFYPFTKDLRNAFIAQEKKYFVRQTFDRGKEPFCENVFGAYLISHYATLHEAKVHFDALKHDKKRFLYVWDNTEHQERLKAAATGIIGYKIYSSTFEKDWERHITDRMEKAIRLYVASFGWRPSRAEGLSTDFYQTFGELYIRLKYKTREVKVKFEEIENLS